MAWIIVTKSGKRFFVKVDNKNLDWLCKYKWNAGPTGYASTTIAGKTILMQRLIMGLKPKDKQLVHHINKNKSDNTEANLIVCNMSTHKKYHSKGLLFEL
jgi:hypothetical protein